MSRPLLNQPQDQQAVQAIETFVSLLQAAVDSGDAVAFNQDFAQDVLWGSPFGAVVSGYDQLHAIHRQMFARNAPRPGTWRYSLEHLSFPSPDVAIAYLRRQLIDPESHQEVALGNRFDELALLVLARRDGHWWLAAGQHVPDRREVYAQSDLLTRA